MERPAMTMQRLHSQLAPVDLLTREEMDETLNKNLSSAIRERVRGLDIARLPIQPVTALAATVNLSGQNPGGGGSDLVFGPNEGDVWMLRRAIVKSSSFVDTAKYLLFRGSTPSDVQFAYTFRFLLDGMIGGATPGQNVNVGFYPANKSLFVVSGEQIYAQVLGGTAGNQYLLEAEAIRCPAEMKGKLL